MKRVCNICGKPITHGYMSDMFGINCTHEGECFEKFMDKHFGKHKWMELVNGKTDEFGGYYICAANTDKGYEGTGVYYTELEE